MLALRKGRLKINAALQRKKKVAFRICIWRELRSRVLGTSCGRSVGARPTRPRNRRGFHAHEFNFCALEKAISEPARREFQQVYFLSISGYLISSKHCSFITHHSWSTLLISFSDRPQNRPHQSVYLCR